MSGEQWRLLRCLSKQVGLHGSGCGAGSICRDKPRGRKVGRKFKMQAATLVNNLASAIGVRTEDAGACGCPQGRQ